MDSIVEDSFVPKCAADKVPYVGKLFATLKDGIEFYQDYARLCGFDTRLSTLVKHGDVIMWRYIVCSREGEKFHSKCDLELKQKRRKRLSMRCGCLARMALKWHNQDGYAVSMFSESHNHPLVEVQFKHFMRLNRNIDLLHQKFILDCAKSNIGPTLSHKLLAEFVGGYDNVCSVLDVRNFSRDMRVFVDGADADMLLNEMKRKKDICSDFTYSYVLDSGDRLIRLFWCDSVSKRNYQVFWDVVAFDTTYSTNKYCLIFAPFTGKDNHGKPVTFAAGLLSSEDSDSFSWLFERFVECMGFCPKMIITDQDLGMKVAIERVLVGTRHRWCMWHIMLKVADKVSKELHANDNFKTDLNSYVWSEMIEPDVFEEWWYHIMLNYGLDEDKWFETMYDCREFWVPANFRDFPLSGLMKTTSISECENSFFKRYTRSSSNLLQFLINFNRAIEAQRESHSHLNYIDSCHIPKMETTLLIEKHAALIYTSKILRVVQDELLAACFYCRMLDGSSPVYRIVDQNGDIFDVEYNEDDDSFVCGCKMFCRIGLVCSHMFFVFKNKGIDYIPEKYVVSRWKKFSLLDSLNGATSDYNDLSVDESKKIEKKIMSKVLNCVVKIGANSEKLEAFLSGINELEQSIFSGTSLQSSTDLKKKLFENYYGACVPESIQVFPPNMIKTKGSGRRIKSNKEKGLKELEKRLRRCAKCKQMANHDSRNCDRVSK